MNTPSNKFAKKLNYTYKFPIGISMLTGYSEPIYFVIKLVNFSIFYLILYVSLYNLNESLAYTSKLVEYSDKFN